MKGNVDLQCKQQYYYALIHLKLLKFPPFKVAESSLEKLGTEKNPLKVVPTLKRTYADLLLRFSPLIIALTLIYIYDNEDDKTKTRIGETSVVRFNDVRGMSECKGELEEIVNILKNRNKYQEMTS